MTYFCQVVPTPKCYKSSKNSILICGGEAFKTRVCGIISSWNHNILATVPKGLWPSHNAKLISLNSSKIAQNKQINKMKLKVSLEAWGNPFSCDILTLGLVRDHKKEPQRHIVRQNFRLMEHCKSNWYPGWRHTGWAVQGKNVKFKCSKIINILTIDKIRGNSILYFLFRHGFHP